MLEAVRRIGECDSSTENIVSMNAAQSETPFGSKVRKGMFRTVSQLYKVSEKLDSFGLYAKLHIRCACNIHLDFVLF